MLPMVPPEEVALIALLNRHIDDNRYSAPEVCDWHSAANSLYALLQGREEEPWLDAMLAVWRDEATPLPEPDTRVCQLECMHNSYSWPRSCPTCGLTGQCVKGFTRLRTPL
jgi:hypothetical protein